MLSTVLSGSRKFYDNSILSGTKMDSSEQAEGFLFYDNSILSGTKIQAG